MHVCVRVHSLTLQGGAHEWYGHLSKVVSANAANHVGPQCLGERFECMNTKDTKPLAGFKLQPLTLERFKEALMGSITGFA